MKTNFTKARIVAYGVTNSDIVSYCNDRGEPCQSSDVSRAVNKSGSRVKSSRMMDHIADYLSSIEKKQGWRIIIERISDNDK